MDDLFVTDCRRIAGESLPFAGAMDAFGEPAERGRWPFNVLARDAVVYSCGAVALPEVPVPHRHLASEIELCRRLSTEAAGLTSPQPFDLDSWVDLGGASSNSYLWPFYMVASEGTPMVEAVTPAEIRRAFGGTIYQPAEVHVEPLREGESWWRILADRYTDPAERESVLGRWRALIRWFEDRSGLSKPSFVVIGEEGLPDWEGQENLGCTFPRLVVGRSRAGSLVGVAGQVVQA